MEKLTKALLDELLNSHKDPKGRNVVYEDRGEREFGYITSWNDRFVFICFDETGRGTACPYDKVRFE